MAKNINKKFLIKVENDLEDAMQDIDFLMTYVEDLKDRIVEIYESIKVERITS
jgi:CYTH domain-containing protein